MNPLLVTMRGPDEIKFHELSNFEAGIIMLHKLDQMLPGVTWGQLIYAGRDTMGRSWLERMASKAGGAVMDAGRGVGGAAMDVARSSGDIIKSAVDATGEKIGEATRLFTDEKVVDGASRAYKAYTDGGGIAGFWGGSSIFGQNSGTSDAEGESAAGGIWDFITNLGSSAKKSASANQAGLFGIPSNVLPWAIAGGAVLVILFARPGAPAGHR
jgi:hypothetical protein